jgi:hypothetical protein
MTKRSPSRNSARTPSRIFFGLISRRLVIVGSNHHRWGNLAILGVIDIETVFVHGSVLNRKSSLGFRLCRLAASPRPWSAELTPNCFVVRDANGQVGAETHLQNFPSKFPFKISHKIREVASRRPAKPRAHLL